ncbi:MAG: IPT/TIG domain-containing protein [Treponema sp.]|nr:IPT/TIG domain-containing protein [Treponema sp.]
MKRIPVITNLQPPIGSPGDIVIITGKNFGNSRGASFVEFGGSRLTASSYLSWTDTEIKVVLPANVQDGLVVVGTDKIKSKPSFFANEREIPVAVRPNRQTSTPVIASLPTTSLAVGDLLVITGSNFGSTYDNAAVYFTASRDDAATRTGVSHDGTYSDSTHYIQANKNDFDYEFWSDTEIQVRVPDGAVTGNIYVQTPLGKSTQQKITIDSRAGTKTFGSSRTYLLQLSADIADIVVTEPTTIRLYFPRPIRTSSQPSIELTECIPEPAITDYQNTIIQQLQITKATQQTKKRFSENFVVSVYEVHTIVRPQAIQPYSSMSENLFATATRSDNFILAADKSVITTVQQIVGNVTNPYNKARLIYNYMIDNYRLEKTAATTSTPLNLLNRKRGDAYDFAIMYTTLLRATGIPALTDSGILIDKDLQARTHWWCEFYVGGIGWIPVDVALGAGLAYQSWTNIDNTREYYFGNLDSQHVTFSRGINEIKSSTDSTKIVQRPRGYALQTVWEESSQKTIKYSSFWAAPIVLGVY